MSPAKAGTLLVIGAGCSGLMFGYLTGVSHTPIAGTLSSAVFAGLVGLATSFLSHRSTEGLMQAAGQKSPSEGGAAARSSMALLGIVLMVFSLLFITGSLLGGWVRIGPWYQSVCAPLTVPWSAPDRTSAATTRPAPPSTPEEAWAWITFSRQAADLGLPAEDIRSVYAAWKARPPTAVPPTTRPSVSGWLSGELPWLKGSPPRPNPVETGK